MHRWIDDRAIENLLDRKNTYTYTQTHTYEYTNIQAHTFAGFCICFFALDVFIKSIAFSLLSKDFIHENEGNQENTCGSLFFCFLSHLEFGIRTDGGIGEYISKLSFIDTPGYFMGMFFFQFISTGCTLNDFVIGQGFSM